MIATEPEPELEEWAALAAVGELVTCAPGDVITTPRGAVVVLTRGVAVQRCLASGLDVAVDVVGAPSLLGIPDGMFSPEWRFVASTAVSGIAIATEKLVGDLKHVFTDLVMRSLEHHINREVRRRKPVDRLIASFVLELSTLYGSAAKPANTIRLPLCDIASCYCRDVRKAQQLLREMERDGIIGVSADSISILDYNRLFAFAADCRSKVP